jgi:hypothetical protein
MRQQDTQDLLELLRGIGLIPVSIRFVSREQASGERPYLQYEIRILVPETLPQ